MGRTRLAIGAAIAIVAIVAGLMAWRAGHAQESRKQALALAGQGDFWEAEPLLRAALDRDPGDVEVVRALAKGYLRNGRKSEPVECLTQWVAAAPDDPEPLLMRLELYRELGQLDQALGDVDRLLEIDPKNLDWRRKRVTVLYSASRFAQAQAECERCLQVRPHDAGLRRSLAEIKRARGDFSGAAVLLDGILRDAPRDTGAMMSRAQLHLSQDEPAQAVPLLRKVVEVDQNKQRAGRYYLALALTRTGATEEAERLMEEVRRMQQAGVMLSDSEGQPDNLPLQMRAARAQFENNDIPKTLVILKHVFSVDPSYGPAHGLMADVLEKQGHFDQAAEHRRRAKDQP